MRTNLYLLVILLLLSGAMFLGERSVVAVSAQQSDLNRTVSGLDRNGERIDILGRRDALRPLSTREVESLLKHRNRYIQAIAIQELKDRRDRGVVSAIRRSFDDRSLKSQDLRFDPHGFFSPEAAVFIASSEYLAALDKEEFMPMLLSRPEVWTAPFLFVRTFQGLGEGWVLPAVREARREDQKAALSYLLSVATTASNVEELRQVLQNDLSPAWEGAARACERVEREACWQALEASLGHRDEAEQLLGRMIQFRKARATAQELFSAAEEAARRSSETEQPVERIRYLRPLIEFIGLSHWMRLTVPSSLVEALRETRSETIVNALQPGGRIEREE